MKRKNITLKMLQDGLDAIEFDNTKKGDMVVIMNEQEKADFLKKFPECEHEFSKIIRKEDTVLNPSRLKELVPI